MEKKPVQSSKTPPKEKIDDLKDLKNQFLAKQISSEWTNILTKKFCEETKGEETTYDTALKIIEMMREMNKNTFKSAISIEFMEKMIDKNNDMTVIACFLKEFTILNTPSSYEYSSSFSYSGGSKKYELSKVIKCLEERIKRAEIEKNLDQLFYSDVFAEFLMFKKLKKIEHHQVFNKDYVQNVRNKIKIIITGIIETIGEQLKNTDVLNEVLVKWICILDASCSYEEMKYLKTISDRLSPPRPTSYYYSNPVSKLNYENIWIMLKNIIDACKFIPDENDFIMPLSNAFVFFEIYSQKQWEELALQFSGDLVETFSAKELSQFFRNVLEESYTDGILCFFIYFTTSLQSRKNGTQHLVTFFHEVVLSCVINKFQSQTYYKHTSFILNTYFFGLCDICTIDETHWNILIRSANYVIHFEKKNFQNYYELIKTLHKTYLKLKKPLYNDREILNFLDNLKMNYSFLSDPSEKHIETSISQAWKLKFSGEMIKSFPKNYLDIETPNNNIKYKGLKNLGNSKNTLKIKYILSLACYINSFVQCLYMTTDFRSKILKLQLGGTKIQSDSVLAELKQLFQNFDEETFESTFEPIILKNSLPEPFKTSFEQQDALEFGRIFLEIIEKILLDAKMKNLVEDLFFGECTNTFECKDCKRLTQMPEKILDLSVNFHDDCYIAKEGAYDLKKMISNFVQTEEFKDNNQYFCENCNKLSSLMIKTPTIKKMPPFLLVTANRFYFDAKLGLRRKLCHKIKECHSFIIKDVFEGSCRMHNPTEEYILYAMIIHAGASLESGHYFALAKDFLEDYWYCFNDTVVQCLGKSPNFHRYLWDYETPYIYFFVNRAMIPVKK